MGSRHSHTVLFGLGIMAKLLHHSTVSSTSNGANICWSCSLFSCCNVYAMNLGYDFTSSLTCKEKLPLKHPIPIYTAQYSFCIVSVGFVLATLLVYISLLRCRSILKSLFIFECILFFLLIDLSLFCLLLIVWQFMLSSGNLSQSAITNIGGPMPGTTKKQHKNSVTLLIMFPLHNSICFSILCAQYYLFSIHLLRFVIFVFGYGTMNILIGIKLQSLTISILYLYLSVI